MNLFLKKLIFFIISAILVHAFSVIAIGSITKKGLGKNFVFPLGNYGHTMMRLQEANQHRPVDGLILGSSHAYRGFDPRIFQQRNISIFNLGLSSETPIQSYYLLKKYYAILQPKFVIQEIYPLLLQNDGTENNSFLLANEPFSVELTKMAFEHFNLHNYHCWLYGSFRSIFHLNDHLPLDIKFGDDRYISGGYSEKDWKPFHSDEILNATEYEPLPEQLQALDSIRKFCESKNCQLYFVITPVTAIEKHHIQNWGSILQKVEEIHPVFDFSRTKEIQDDTHYYDYDHMNQKGVEIFNPILMDSLFN